MGTRNQSSVHPKFFLSFGVLGGWERVARLSKIKQYADDKQVNWKEVSNELGHDGEFFPIKHTKPSETKWILVYCEFIKTFGVALFAYSAWPPTLCYVKTNKKILQVIQASVRWLPALFLPERPNQRLPHVHLIAWFPGRLVQQGAAAVPAMQSESN